MKTLCEKDGVGKSLFSYAFEARSLQIGTFLGTVLAVWLLCKWKLPAAVQDMVNGLLALDPRVYPSYINPSVGFVTLIVAVMVWINNLRNEWESSLPKRMNVVFMLAGKKVMECQDANLMGEGDIRSWAQQIGKQMAIKAGAAGAGSASGNLEFPPFGIQVKEWIDKTRRMKVYDVVSRLDSYPLGSTKAFEDQAATGQCWFWCRGMDAPKWQAPGESCTAVCPTPANT